MNRSGLKAILHFLILTPFLISGCKTIKTSEYRIARFETDLKNTVLKNDGSNIDTLTERYPNFLPIFTEHIIGIGPVDDPNRDSYLLQFINDPVIQEIYQKSEVLYKDFKPFAKRITDAIVSLQKEINSPEGIKITTYISGFNQSFVTLPGQLAIGIDNYLGSDYLYYKQLGLPQYIIDGMNSEFIMADAVRAWIQSEMEGKQIEKKLLDQMVYEGIILYTAKHLLPKNQLLKIFHYTQEQWDWCIENESSMWKFLIDQELLFNSDPLLIRRLTGEAPFSRDFGNDSPPRAGSWLGYRIVEKYMSRKNGQIQDLFFKLSPSEILSLSAYRP
jgi:hypothetical protein